MSVVWIYDTFESNFHLLMSEYYTRKKWLK